MRYEIHRPDGSIEDVSAGFAELAAGIQRQFDALINDAIKDVITTTSLGFDDLELAYFVENPRKAEVRRRGTDEVFARVELKLVTPT